MKDKLASIPVATTGYACRCASAGVREDLDVRRRLLSSTTTSARRRVPASNSSSGGKRSGEVRGEHRSSALLPASKPSSSSLSWRERRAVLHISRCIRYFLVYMMVTSGSEAVMQGKMVSMHAAYLVKRRKIESLRAVD